VQPAELEKPVDSEESASPQKEIFARQHKGANTERDVDEHGAAGMPAAPSRMGSV